MTQGYFKGWIFLMTLLTGILIQIGTNLTNDLFDFLKGADTEKRKGFLRVTQAGLVDPPSMKKAIVLTFTAALASGAALIFHGGFPIALMLALYVLLSVLYTAGPFPLAYLGLGEVFVLFLYGPGAVLITYYLQTNTLSLEAFLAGLCPGALSMAILIINNIRDIEEDRLANKKTLSVRFGRNFGKGQFLFACILAFVPVVLLCPSHPFCLLTLLALFPAASLVYAVLHNKDPSLLNPLFAKTGKLLWLFTLLFCIGWML
jgi:1,4-dihydroxy-2-naphthoate octaprenyltransferase